MWRGAVQIEVCSLHAIFRHTPVAPRSLPCTGMLLGYLDSTGLQTCLPTWPLSLPALPGPGSRAFIRTAADDEELPVPSPTFLLQNIYNDHAGAWGSSHCMLCAHVSSCAQQQAAFCR